MNSEIYPPVPPTPKEYWDDFKWANAHFAEISESYPNLWVAIVNKKVVASGKVISEVRKKAQELTGKKNFPVMLAEKGIHVYANKSVLSDQNRS